MEPQMLATTGISHTTAIVWLCIIGFMVFIGIIMAMVALVYMLQQNRSPQSSVAWLIGIVLCPWIVVPLFIYAGGRKWRRLSRMKGYLSISGQHEEEVVDSRAVHVETLLKSHGIPTATAGNDIRMLATGIDVYDAMVHEINAARTSICIETFIFLLDDVGSALLDLLIKRAKDGIEVRLLLDAIGDMAASKKIRATKQHKRLAQLTAAGGKVAYFMPTIHNPLRGSGNLRNHRKIALFDGTIAISGGTNISEQYIGPTELDSRWPDCSMRIKGPVVESYAQIFAHDWTFASGETHVPAGTHEPSPGGQVAQVVTAGPDTQGDPLHDALLTMMYLASDRLWVVTPWFVPDDAICDALSSAARRGVDVRIFVPSRSIVRIADWAGDTYLRQCQAAGATIHKHRHGMFHAKLILVDDRLAAIGSANLDMRSLFLNYECSLLMYSPQGIGDVEAWIKDLESKSDVGLAPIGPLGAAGEGLARTLGPLL
jgi:cardiolipin synthase